jgi:hypothetical protein
MQRSFGTEISGNRGRNDELTESQRAGILSTVEAGESKSSIASRLAARVGVFTRQSSVGTPTNLSNLSLDLASLRSLPAGKNVYSFELLANTLVLNMQN